MKEQTPEKKLAMIEAALDHFYDIDTEILLRSYRDHLDERAAAKNPPPPVDRETAIAYAEKHGLAYDVFEPKKRRHILRTNGYGDNFAPHRRGAWTH